MVSKAGVKVFVVAGFSEADSRAKVAGDGASEIFTKVLLHHWAHTGQNLMWLRRTT